MAERSINLNLKSISLDGLWGVGLQSILTSDGSPAIRVSVGRPADRTSFGQVYRTNRLQEEVGTSTNIVERGITDSHCKFS